MNSNSTTHSRRLICWIVLLGVSLFAVTPAHVFAQKKKKKIRLTEKEVVNTINSAIKAIELKQLANGAWTKGSHPVGTTALVALSLLNSGVPANSPRLSRAIKYLREVEEPNMTYEVSLLLMVLAHLNEKKDRPRMQSLVAKLERSQIRRGPMAGCWSYFTKAAVIDNGGDRSNGQFAILGLFEAAKVGIPVSRQTWEMAKKHWELAQNPDGGWGYSGLPGRDRGNDSRGSMTVAGIASMVMIGSILQDDSDVDDKGNPNCCGEKQEDKTLARGIAWLDRHVQFGSNPGGSHLFYYLYGLERAGRLSGQRWFGKNDWFREGARFLIDGFNRRSGLWDGSGAGSNALVSTSFALLFLSKGLAPVLINKLKFPDTAGDKDSWNHHPYDVRNITNRITGMEKWPKLLTWQVVDVDLVEDASDFTQSPVLYITGQQAPKITDTQLNLIKEYINLGGFVFAVNNCQRADFHDAMFKLVRRMYPTGDVQLERLKPDHAIFKSEYALDGDAIELYGADFGCRTAFVYSPDDIGCLINKWSQSPQPNRHKTLKGRVERAMRIGVNAIAYATGREPPNKLRQQELASEKGAADNISRGLLRVAQLRHTGGWDTAPKAARNLLLALNRTVGTTASTKPQAITPSDQDLMRYSMLVMHGRHRFNMTENDIKALRQYLDRGGVLFADACCGASQFDQAFRAMVRRLYPNEKMVRIPVKHEIFSPQIGHDLSRVRRRAPESSEAKALQGNIINGEPFLEGVTIDGRLVVIYSKYDISCALERQASVACTGYLPEDAVKIAVNIVLYSKLQKPPLTARVK